MTIPEDLVRFVETLVYEFKFIFGVIPKCSCCYPEVRLRGYPRPKFPLNLAPVHYHQNDHEGVVKVKVDDGGSMLNYCLMVAGREELEPLFDPDNNCERAGHLQALVIAYIEKNYPDLAQELIEEQEWMKDGSKKLKNSRLVREFGI